MLISKAHIKAFRSIFEFTIPIEPKITLMIGPNESGKTNLLRSLEAFKPGFPFTNNHTCQYSDYYYQGKCPEITLVVFAPAIISLLFGSTTSPKAFTTTNAPR